MATDEDLHTLDSVILTHGTTAPEGCLEVCPGCAADCKNLRSARAQKNSTRGEAPDESMAPPPVKKTPPE